jgi:hypothetical protein
MINNKYQSLGLTIIMLSMTTITGCVSMKPPVISRGVIENWTETSLRDVTVSHLPTHVKARFSVILPQFKAEIGFEPKELLAEEAVLQWAEDGQFHSVRLVLPQTLDTEETGPVILVYSIYSGGRATVKLKPER